MTATTASKSRTQKRSGAGKPDDPAQYSRFLEAAREAEAAQTEQEADRAFRKVAKPAKPKHHR